MLPAVEIVRAIRDPMLINDQEISVAQLTALRALYGLPLDTNEELAVYQRATEKDTYKPQERREAAYICGRRSGKDSKLAAPIAIFEACFRQHRLAVGERGYVLLLAATREQARICYGYIRARLEASPLLASMIEGEPRADEIDLANGVTISVIPANFRTIRGRSVICAICSEVAFWIDAETASNPAKEILKALRPSMSTFPNAKLILISSPFAKQGPLWDMFQKRHSWFGNRLVWRLDSLSMNPSLDRELLREEEENDPENFAREFGAAFWDSASSFLSADAIEASIVRDRLELQPHGQRHYTAALDAGFRGDLFAFSIVHPESDVVVHDVTRAWRGSRAKPVNLAAVLDEIAATLKRFQVGTIFGDNFCSEPIKQALATRGIRFEQRTTLGARAQCFNSLRTLITSGKMLLLDDPATIAELKNLQLIVTAGGNSRVEAIGSGHDDRAVTLALAAHECIAQPHREPWVAVIDISAPPAPGQSADKYANLAPNDPGPERWWRSVNGGASFGGGRR